MIDGKEVPAETLVELRALADRLRRELDACGYELGETQGENNHLDAEVKRLQKELAQRELPEDAIVRAHGQGQESVMEDVARWLGCAPTIDAIETACRDARTAGATIRLLREELAEVQVKRPEEPPRAPQFFVVGAMRVNGGEPEPFIAEIVPEKEQD